MWDWSDAEAATCTTRSRPTSAIRRVNANGLIYGSPEEAPTSCRCSIRSTTRPTDQASVPRSEARRSSTGLPRGPSPYWGDEAIWDGHTSIHNPMHRREGPRLVHRAHPAARRTRTSARRAAIIRPRRSRRSKVSARQLSMYDPKTREVDADRHLLHDAPSVLRLRREQHAVDQRGRPGQRRGRLARTRGSIEETGDEAKARRAGRR